MIANGNRNLVASELHAQMMRADALRGPDPEAAAARHLERFKRSKRGGDDAGAALAADDAAAHLLQRIPDLEQSESAPALQARITALAREIGFGPFLEQTLAPPARALSRAAYAGIFDDVLQLARDADPARVDEALGWAAFGGQDAVVKLLTARASIGGLDGALAMAASGGHLSTVAQLLADGASVHHDDDAALRSAARNGHASVITFLLDPARGRNRADVHARDDGALHAAAYFGHSAAVAQLIAGGAAVNAGDSKALRAAAGEGHADVAAQLHAAGARLTAGGAEFLVAAERGYTDIVRTLVAAGTDVNMQRGAALLAAAPGGRASSRRDATRGADAGTYCARPHREARCRRWTPAPPSAARRCDGVRYVVKTSSRSPRAGCGCATGPACPPWRPPRRA
jgi:hypothetical protein